MAINGSQVVIRCLRTILKPIMRFCLRHSLRIQDVLEAAKIGLIEAAMEDLRRRGERINVSRLSVVTGIHRRDIARIYKEERTVDESRSLISRVIGQWQSDPRFRTKTGKPRVLALDGETNEFHELVKATSSELHPGTVMFELERMGAVSRSPRGLKLEVSSYVPKEDPEAGFEILAKDAEDLIAAVEENIFMPKDIPNLHARTEYNNIRSEAVPEIRSWLLTEGSAFHRKARNFLSQYDLDINPDPAYKQDGVKVIVGAFGKVSVDAGEMARKVSAVFLLMLLVWGGCAGGGTSGTGIKVVSGRVQTETGEPVAGAAIEIPETGQQTLTNQNGNFSVAAATDSPVLQVNVDIEGTVSSVLIEDLPQGNAAVSMEISVDNTSNEVTGSDIDVTPAESPPQNTGGSSPDGTQDITGEIAPPPEDDIDAGSPEDSIPGEEVQPGGDPGSSTPDNSGGTPSAPPPEDDDPDEVTPAPPPDQEQTPPPDSGSEPPSPAPTPAPTPAPPPAPPPEDDDPDETQPSAPPSETPPVDPGDPPPPEDDEE